MNEWEEVLVSHSQLLSEDYRMCYVAKPSLQCNAMQCFDNCSCTFIKELASNLTLEAKELLVVVLTVNRELFETYVWTILCQAFTGTHLFGCYLGIWPFGEDCPPSRQIPLDVCITPCIPDTLTVQHNCT